MGMSKAFVKFLKPDPADPQLRTASRGKKHWQWSEWSNKSKESQQFNIWHLEQCSSSCAWRFSAPVHLQLPVMAILGLSQAGAAPEPVQFRRCFLDHSASCTISWMPSHKMWPWSFTRVLLISISLGGGIIIPVATDYRSSPVHPLILSRHWLN